MKNLTTRTKMLLAIAGVVIVVAVAGLVLLGPGDDLFGSTVIHISPQNPTIPLYQAIDMSINSVGDCEWSTSVPNVANYIAGAGACRVTNGAYVCDNMYYDYNTKKTKLIANWPGQTTISAKCALFTRSTTVTVGQPAPVTISPANPTIAVGGSVKLSTTDASCTWSTASPGVTLSGGNIADYVTVTGKANGVGGVTATCRGGTATTMVYVQ